jgi:hypothetical protein
MELTGPCSSGKVKCRSSLECRSSVNIQVVKATEREREREKAGSIKLEI